MASVSDIITYIGIPLTLLGILPIFYTILNSLLTHRNILRLLRSNTPVFATTTTSTSGSLISGIIEVTLPRFSITPLDRSEPDYWALNPQASSLPGGSWTLLNWNYVVTATKTYRLQFSDDLQIPQAEVDFDELMSFLMDRGAVPDAKGLHMLRVSGLWTPTGTPLLVSPGGLGSALRVAGAGDSDGILSLALRWEKGWDQREEESLPVGWMRLEVPSLPISVVEDPISDEKKDHEFSPSDDAVLDEQPKLQNDHLPTPDLEKPYVNSTSTKYTPTPTSLRFRLASIGSVLSIQSPTWEHSHISLPPGSQPSVTHLTCPSSTAYTLFPSLALTYALSNSLPLYTCTFPSSMLTLTSPSSSVPAGVMVLLGLLPEDEAPEWGETKYDPHEESSVIHSRFMASHRAMASESMMSPEQANIARRAREAESRARMMEDTITRMKRDRERIELREREAVGSVRLSAKVVAERAFSFLAGEGKVDAGKGLQGAVERLLVGMVRSEDWAVEGACMVLNRWKEWAAREGMSRDDLAVVRGEVIGFAFAACAIGLIAEVGNKDEGGLAADMRECVRIWKKVRLG